MPVWSQRRRPSSAASAKVRLSRVVAKTRPPLSRDEIEAHAKTYADQAFKVLDREATEIRYNSEWLAELNLEGVVRLAASMTLAQMLVREDFRKRFDEGTPVHLHEFLYPLAQGHDACHLEADVQVGGTDQLFNLMAGRDVMKGRGLKPQVCLTMPILPGTDGLVHISHLAHERVDKVTDVLHEGDEVLVRVIDIDRSGKIRLSRKEALDGAN